MTGPPKRSLLQVKPAFSPLAIEFAAARTDLFDVRTIAQRLDDRFGLLTTGRRNAVRRHQTLRAAIEWSCGLLSADKKMVLRRLSVFSTHFGLEDAIEVVGADDLAGCSVLESLSDLVAKSIVVGDVSGNGRTLHSPSSSGGVMPFTQGSPVFINVNEIGHDLFGAIRDGGSGAPTGPSMQGKLGGGETR